MPAPDLHLIFPPQWSPFQPFLSSPSLKAYLRERGFDVLQSDWNVDFYEYFIDQDRLPQATARLRTYIDTLGSEHEDYRSHAYLALGILSDFPAKRALVERIRQPHSVADVGAFHESVMAFKRLLHAFSVAEPVVEVGTSSLNVGQVLSSHAAIDAFCTNPAQNPFLPFFAGKIERLAGGTPRYFGLSVIGTEQVLPALTLSRLLKTAFPEIPVIFGGSVFSRLVERHDSVAHFFGTYFDYVIRYEGERPLAALLSASGAECRRTPNLVYCENGRVIMNDLCPQVSMEDIPTPDFTDLDLAKYFTPEVVLPILSTRGCYWDKCAFCYHGMIYGDRYRMRDPDMLRDDIEKLHAAHGARHFAFNDEAIPPKLFEKLPARLPKGKYYFTGLYKFEKYYRPHHYRDMYAAGFRSLYIGLESANERVQRHMKKNNTQDVMLSNLADAHAAGIWNHTFNFFGFPTETREEAMETANFLIDHADIIHSEGTGTFSFEHNAPISKHPERFGVTKVIEKQGSVLEIYYDYETGSGLSAAEASEMVNVFSAMKQKAGAYRYAGWIPREHLLVLLARHDRDSLLKELQSLDSDLQTGARWWTHVNWFSLDARNQPDRAPRYFIVNTQAGRVLETNRDAMLLMEFLPKGVEAEAIVSHFPMMGQILRQ